MSKSTAIIQSEAWIRACFNPRIETVVRTHSDEEAALLRREHAGTVFMGEHELALAMSRFVLDKVADAAGSAPVK